MENGSSNGGVRPSFAGVYADRTRRPSPRRENEQKNKKNHIWWFNPPKSGSTQVRWKSLKTRATRLPRNQKVHNETGSKNSATKPVRALLRKSTTSSLVNLLCMHSKGDKAGNMGAINSVFFFFDPRNWRALQRNLLKFSTTFP